MAPIDPCFGRASGCQCWGGVTIAPASTPTSGQWFQVWDFDTTPPTLSWHNAGGLLAANAPAVMRKKKPPKRPKKPPI